MGRSSEGLGGLSEYMGDRGEKLGGADVGGERGMRDERWVMMRMIGS